MARNSQAAAFSGYDSNELFSFWGPEFGHYLRAASIEALTNCAFVASAQFVAVPVHGEPVPDPVLL